MDPIDPMDFMDPMDPIDPGVDVDLGYQDSDWGITPKFRAYKY